MALVIDAHQHFWQLSQPFDYGWLQASQNAPIRRDYLPNHLLALIQSVHVDKTIFVQTQHNLAENRWALQLAEQNEFLAGVVGWVDLANPDCEQQLLEFTASPKFVGVRHVTQDEPDDNFIIREDVVRGLRVLEKHEVPFDLLFYVKHLHHAETLARQLPNLYMVIDHLAKPHIKDQQFDDWLPHLRAAAKFPNLFCKLSGMVTEADWRHWRRTDLQPYIDAALECFGPQRCMFGSDWPVCELAATYEQVYQALVESIASLSTTERDAVMGGTAARFYGLE